MYSKLERYGIRGKCLDWYKSYLSDRSLKLKCRTADTSRELTSKTHQVDYGAPQGSCLGPLLFLIFTNDLYVNLIHTNCILFADDTTLYFSHKKLSYAKWCIEEDLKILEDWFTANKLTLNLNKTVSMLFSRKKSNEILKLNVGKIDIPQVHEVKFLGVWVDSNLTWNKHINTLENKIKQNRHLLRNAKYLLDKQTKRMIYFSHIYSHLKYCILIWGNGLPGAKTLKLQRLQNSCIKIINNSKNVTSQYKNMNILKITEMITLENLKFGYKFKHGELPGRIGELITSNQNKDSLIKIHKYPTRNKKLPKKPRSSYNQYSKSFLCNWIDIFSTLPVTTKESVNITQFGKKMQKLLIVLLLIKIEISSNFSIYIIVVSLFCRIRINTCKNRWKPTS